MDNKDFVAKLKGLSACSDAIEFDSWGNEVVSDIDLTPSTKGQHEQIH
jgi:hypothetical protein